MVGDHRIDAAAGHPPEQARLAQAGDIGHTEIGRQRPQPAPCLGESIVHVPLFSELDTAERLSPPDYLRVMTLVMGQRSRLSWDIPAADSFLLNQAIYRLNDADYKRTLKELDQLLELDPILRKPVRNLSLGERMKVELAAGLLHRPQVLFLDEPTSALDAETENLLLEALERLMAGRTTFIIAHRLSTVRRANCILVLKDGQIVERGTHQELLTLGKVYAHLHEVQFGTKAPGARASLPAQAGAKPSGKDAGAPGAVTITENGGNPSRRSRQVE